MTVLEDMLRATLARQAEEQARPLSSSDLADRVIHRARRRRRIGLAGRSVVVVMTLSALFVAAYPIGVQLTLPSAVPQSSPAGPAGAAGAAPEAVPSVLLPSRAAGGAAAEAVPVDMVVDHQLITRSAGTFDVAFAGTVRSAYQVVGGWLLLGTRPAATDQVLWYLQEGREVRPLLHLVDGLAVDSGGRRLAWRSGQTLFLGSFANGAVTVQAKTTVADHLDPVRIIGDAVLLAGSARLGRGSFELWWPARGDRRAGVGVPIDAIYGWMSGSDRLVGLVQVTTDAGSGDVRKLTDQWCLGLLDTGSPLTASHVSCGFGFVTGTPGAVSPDGRWLVAGLSGKAVLVDLNAIFKAGAAPTAAGESGRSTATASPVVGLGPVMRGEVIWLDRQTVVYLSAEAQSVVLIRLRAADPNDGGEVKVYSVPVAGLSARAPVLLVQPA